MNDGTSGPPEDQLTPREALHREAMWGLLNSGIDDAATTADRLIDAYAHSLAEQQRQHMADAYEEERQQFLMVDHKTELQHGYGRTLADLIDPEVSA